MTAITRNLPWFIRDLGVSIVGQVNNAKNSTKNRNPNLFSFFVLQKCYASLVENLDIHDVECLKLSLSKGLGLGIVVGGSIMKVPQLMLSE